MSDIPEHLIDAYRESDSWAYEESVQAFLAALRPEDAHLVPAWDKDRARLAEYERAINWGTACLSCAPLLSRLYTAEAEIERLTANQAESTRMKLQTEADGA